MPKKSLEHLKPLEQQYESSPYPHIPLEKSPIDNYNSLFINNLTTSYYLYQQKIINTKNKLILDVGCGSGWTSLNLAVANPDAKIICIDLSKNSLNTAEKRLKHHNFDNIEYHQIAMENIAELNYEYDYINCEDVLYFSASPIDSLKALKSVLKPKGIIRGNFHSYYQRFYSYLSQELFRCLGLFDDNPGDFEIEVVADTMKNLHPNTILKASVGRWFDAENLDLTSENNKERVLMNDLIQNDKGYTIPEIFEILEKSQLHFLSMVNWRKWGLRDLFKDKNKLPTTWEFILENTSEAEKLHFFELINPIHRLIDFWCVHDTDLENNIKSVSFWDDNEWKSGKIHLHPQLQSSEIKEDLLKSIQKQEHWEMSKYITLPTLGAIIISPNLSALLLPLFEQPQTFEQLVSLLLKIQPLDLVTLEETTPQQAQQQVKDLIIKLETFLYLLVEQ